jgi:hypothetical protein
MTVNQLTNLINTIQEPKNRLQVSKNDENFSPIGAASLAEHFQCGNLSELKFLAKPSLACKLTPCINSEQEDKPYI